MLSTRRLFNKAIGVAFDIDGVLLRSNIALDRAKDALELLNDKGVPFVFVTNGGGTSESVKRRNLEKYLQLSFTDDQILLSHTPFKEMAKSYRCGDQVLVIGGSAELAVQYGFSQPLTPEDLRQNCGDTSRFDIKAAFIYHEPLEWGENIQVLSDVLLGDFSSDKGDGKIQVVPLYASNSDLVYKADHWRPRYTQGAFLEAFSSVFKNYTGFLPSIERYGKPFKVQFQHAEKLLDARAYAIGAPPPSKIYMIGDNPKSDIRGARLAGPRWASILVRSGVFGVIINGQGRPENDSFDPADFVVEDVYDAVQLIMSREM